MRELQKNARLSNAELAELVGMSTTACWNRTRQLEAEGYIRGYVALLDQQKLGFADVVLLEVTLNRHDDDALARFGAELAMLPEVLEAYLVSGDYDYLLRIVVKDTRDYERLLRSRGGVALAPGKAVIAQTIAPGEIVGLAGLDGHGQEAFLKVLAGLYLPREGSVKLEKNSAYKQLVDDGLAAQEQHSKLTDPVEAHDWLHGSLADVEAFRDRVFPDKLIEMDRTTELWSRRAAKSAETN